MDSGAERLLASLAGVISARMVTDHDGKPTEIHLLTTQELHPKQIVRNVESALCAGLGIEVDRRIISVAQVRGDAQAAATVPVPPPAERAAHSDPAPATGTPPRTSPAAGTKPDGSTHPTAPASRRVVLVGYDARLDSARRATCRVTLRSGPDEFCGEHVGPDTRHGRAEAAAAAVFVALTASRGTDRLGLEGVTLVETGGRTYVLLAARALDGRKTYPLTGAAALDRSPEEAGILAALQATNRWRVRT